MSVAILEYAGFFDAELLGEVDLLSQTRVDCRNGTVVEWRALSCETLKLEITRLPYAVCSPRLPPHIWSGASEPFIYTRHTIWAPSFQYANKLKLFSFCTFGVCASEPGNLFVFSHSHYVSTWTWRYANDFIRIRFIGRMIQTHSKFCVCVCALVEVDYFTNACNHYYYLFEMFYIIRAEMNEKSIWNLQ